MKVCSSVRLETRTTRMRSVDNGIVWRCLKRGNAPRTPDEIETFPLSREKCDICQKRPVDHRLWQRRGRSRRVNGAADLRRWDIPGSTSDTLPTPQSHAICSNGSSFPILHAIMTNKRYESYLVVLKQIEARARALNVRPVFAEGTSSSPLTSNAL